MFVHVKGPLQALRCEHTVYRAVTLIPALSGHESGRENLDQVFFVRVVVLICFLQ